MSEPIFAYPARASLAAGEDLVLHVRAGGGAIDVMLARSGARLEPVLVKPRSLPERSGTWPAYGISLPPEVRPGAYVARVVARGEPCEPLLDARHGAAFFVVRPRQPAPILVNVPLFTYHAYSVGPNDPDGAEAAGASLYTGGKRVSLARPGGGTGGRVWDERNVDVYDRASPRQTWAHWDAKAVAWLERAGFAYDACTDLDLHEDDAILQDRTILLCFGHHEYWTDAMRARVERFVASGGNVAFFGANSLWFRSAYDAGTGTLGRAGAWPQSESALTGVSYGRGGGWWQGARPPAGLTVTDAAHWIFADTGLRDGDTFGADDRLAGYECDGFDATATAPGAVELARADLGAQWGDPQTNGEVFAGGRASLTIAQPGGTVLSAGTVDWPRLMESDPIVAQITRTIITRLAAPGRRER